MSNTINKSELITIREIMPDDTNFIYASWLRGLYYGDSWLSDVPKSVFMDHYHKVIAFILSKPTTTVKVACLKDDPSVILGYAVMSDVAVHWIFVKKNWRGIRLAKDLIPSHLNTATHSTKVGMAIIKHKGWIYNPFLV
jgi:hypothetical protein